MATTTTRIEVINRNVAHALVQQANYFMADAHCDLIFAWHVIDREAKMVIYSAPTRDMARQFANFYKRDQAVSA